MRNLKTISLSMVILLLIITRAHGMEDKDSIVPEIRSTMIVHQEKQKGDSTYLLASKQEYKDDILQWIEEEIDDIRNTEKIFLRSCIPANNMEKVIAGIGITLGLLSPISQWNLSKEFWSRIWDNEAFEIIMGTISAIPIFAFNAKVTKEELLNILYYINPSESQEKIREKKNYKERCFDIVKKIPLEIFKIMGGVSSTLGYSYLHYLYYSPLIGEWCLAFIIPNTITGTITGYWALSNNTNMLFNVFKEKCSKEQNDINSSEEKIKEIQKKLSINRSIIEKMELNEIDKIISSDTHDFLQILPGIYDSEESSSDLPKKLFQSLGWCIGSLGSWPVQPVTVEGIKIFLNAMGLKDPTTVDILSEVVGWYSCITVASLLSFPTYNIFGKIYDGIKNKYWRDYSFPYIGLHTIYAATAAASSTPRVELALHYVSSPIAKALAIPCVAIGRLALNYFGLTTFFNCSSIAEAKKQKLIDLIDKISDFCPKMDKEALEIFYQHFFKQIKRETTEPITELVE